MPIMATGTQTYRISAEVITGPKTVGYKKPTLDFTELSGDAHKPKLTPAEAKNWLDHTWYHFRQSWPRLSSHLIWRRHRLDQIRLVLEMIEPDNSTTVVGTTADWDMMVTSSSRN